MKRPLTILTMAGALALASTVTTPSSAADEDEFVDEDNGSAAASSAEEGEYDDDDEVADRIRLRGGFSFNGGVFSIPSASATGGAVSLGVRLGAQFNHYFSVYYQVTPLGGIISKNSEIAGALFIYNSFLAGLTLLDFLDLGFGPSVDVFAVGAANASGAAGGNTGVGFGLHTRVALIIGSGPTKDEARRSGFAIGVDFHPHWLDGTTLLTATVGIGGSWY